MAAHPVRIDETAEAVSRILSVPGQLRPDEAELLYDLARNVSEGCIVEVGSYRGRSTVALALGARDGHGPPVYAIDPHEEFVGALGGHFGPADRVAFFQNALRMECVETIRLVNLSSEVVAPGWDRPVGMLWIDGDHTYEGVSRDLECWEPHLIPGAPVAFHDSMNPRLGPARLLSELSKRGGYQRKIRVSSTTVLLKSA